MNIQDAYVGQKVVDIGYPQVNLLEAAGVVTEVMEDGFTVDFGRGSKWTFDYSDAKYVSAVESAATDVTEYVEAE